MLLFFQQPANWAEASKAKQPLLNEEACQIWSLNKQASYDPVSYQCKAAHTPCSIEPQSTSWLVSRFQCIWGHTVHSLLISSLLSFQYQGVILANVCDMTQMYTECIWIKQEVVILLPTAGTEKLYSPVQVNQVYHVSWVFQLISRVNLFCIFISTACWGFFFFYLVWEFKITAWFNEHVQW